MNHKGVALIEIYQNCIIFNDKAFGPVTGRENREDRMVYLEDGKPLVFGKQKDKAVRLKGLKPEVVDLKSVSANELIVHDEKSATPHYAYLLTQMTYPEMPVPFGVFRSIEKPTYESMLDNQIKDAVKKKGKGNLQDLIYGAETWTVK